MAGESARDVARRQREKAERLQRSADKWERGAAGEVTTAAVLDGLIPHGWTTFHDVRWPGRQRANIDHIAVGPTGVFVIDSKNWSGDVRVVDDVLYSGSWRKEREVAAAAEAAIAVTQVLQGLPATPVLCFLRPEPVSGRARDVTVCSSQNLVETLTSRPPVLGIDSMRRATAILQWQLTSAQAPARAVARQARQPRPVRQPRPARATVPRRPGGARKLAGRLAALVLGVLVILLGIGFALSVISSVGRGLSDATQFGGGQSGATGVTETSAAPVLGDVVSLGATQNHPALRVKVDKVLRVRSTKPEDLQQGYHLVAVRFTIRNTGTEIWGASSPSPRFSALTSDGRHPSQGYYAALPSRKLLPAAFNLRPKKIRQGYVVFSVANGAKLVRVSIQNGFSSSDAAEWLFP